MRVGKHKPENSQDVSTCVLLLADLLSGVVGGLAERCYRRAFCAVLLSVLPSGVAGGLSVRKTLAAGKILLAKYFAGFYTLYQRVGVAHQDRATVS